MASRSQKKKKWLPGPRARIINQTDEEKLKKTKTKKNPTKQQLVFTHQSLDAHTVEQKAIFFPPPSRNRMNAHFFFFVIAPGRPSLWSVIYNEACDYRGGLGGGGREREKKPKTQHNSKRGRVRTADAVVTSTPLSSRERLAVGG